MKRRVSNPVIKEAIKKIRSISKTGNKKFWSSVEEMILKPRSRRPEINVGKISKLTKENDVVLVPGKLLGDGLIDHPITVGALFASKSAIKKIVEAGGTFLPLTAFIERFPDGSNVKIFGG
ncbi:MAG: 50S ribosomal protein L18e [Nitrososphaeria archaeon]|nr:50S ribosomal protein L18e [Nitrososphaeria archaeon]